jgi:CheY-like chemotaxis protein
VESKYKILVIEDDLDIQESLEIFLEMENFGVISAYNGQEALQRLSSGARPDAIILDLMMPVMNGYEFLARLDLPESKELAEIPVVIVSAAKDAERLALERDLRYVPKPFELKVLLGALQDAVLSHRHA